MKRILFVDDEPNVLEGLKRMLRPFRHEWEMKFAASGPEALAILAGTPAEVIVTDMRMPGMNGGELLTEVARRYPHMVRIILSGTEDQDLRMKAAVTAHQYLSKPCHGAGLRDVVNRAFALRERLARPELSDLITRVEMLPSCSASHDTLLRLVDSPSASVQDVGAVVTADMAMTAKVLQLVNSTFFGHGRHITNPAEAVAYLGLDSMRALAASGHVFSPFRTRPGRRFSLQGLQEHACAVARRAVRIAKSQLCSKQMLDDIFVAALLHDIGKLVLAAEFPVECDDLLASELGWSHEQAQAERSTYGTTHAEIGSYLLWLWGLSDTIVEAVAFHHDPARAPSGGFRPLTVVHLADAHELGIPMDLEYLERAGVPADRVASIP